MKRYTVSEVKRSDGTLMGHLRSRDDGMVNFFRPYGSTEWTLLGYNYIKSSRCSHCGK